MRGGETAINPNVYGHKADGSPYMFQLHANIRSVQPAAGSTAGGTLLTITGEGFSQSQWGLGSTSIVVGGSVCDVVAASYAQVTCITRAQPQALDPVLTTPLRGLLPGSRGVDYTFLSL